MRRVIPAQYRDPDDLWFALALRARTIIYNSDELQPDQVPKTYAEVGDPKWKGKICLRNSSNGYQQSLVASMIAQDGRDATLKVLEGWTRNAEIYANDTELIEAMAAGACEVGIANHYYLARARSRRTPTSPSTSSGPTRRPAAPTMNVSGGGVTKYAEHPRARPEFLEWLGDRRPGACWSTATIEFPANIEVPAEPLITKEFGTDFVRQPLDAKEIGRLNPEAVELMDEAGFG